MNSVPRVSVVMGVYNGEKTLRDTIESIIVQSIDDWEFIIVDDASTDSTSQILESYAARDHRLRVIRQSKNTGLTQALIVGCRAARGQFIARQDNGDYSFASRLEKQCKYLSHHHNIVALGCGMRRIGPNLEFLGDVTRNLSPQQVTRTFLESGKAITHASAMIRKTSYDAAGGYRPQFRVAQDIDLWYRLTDYGLLAEIPEILSYIAIDLRGISARNNSKQHRLAQIARESYWARKMGENDTFRLSDAERISQESSPKGTFQSQRDVGDPYYFVGSELYALGNPACRQYLWVAIRQRHRILKSLTKYISSFRFSSPISACKLSTLCRESSLK